MYVLLIIIFSAIHHAIPCYAMPIPESVSAVGEQNAFMLGTLTFFILGIALIGCACCRRQKKGFEEFQNELSSQENNKTEYPIFRALSPESQRNHLNTNSNVMAVNNSNENLITDDYDNNNGPISIADLENIENNNAIDYIQSQNAIEIPIESPEQIRTSEDLVELHNSSSNLIQNISSVSSAISEEDYSISNSSSCHNFIEDVYESDKNINDHPDNNVPITNEIIKNEWKIIDKNLSLINTETDNKVNAEEKVFNFLLKNDEQQIENVISTTVMNDETNKNSEENSIEEALRALDNVIESEDINIDEEEIFNKKDEESSINLQYVIQQLFINNIDDKENNMYNSDTWTEEISTRYMKNDMNDEQNHISKDTIRNTAELLIDSIMKESSQIVEMLKNTVEYKECFEKSFAISKTYTNIDNIVENNSPNKSFDLSKSNICYLNESCDENFQNLSHNESLENLFTDNIGTSTPCVRNKFLSKEKFYTDKNSKLRLDSEDSLESKNDDINDLKIIISPIENETFDINRTFDVDEKKQFGDFIHPGDPCTSRQALERDFGNTIDHEDNNFKDLTTLTPMNTPIELNYSCETWNQMLQKTSNTNQQEIENFSHIYHKEDDQNDETFDVVEDENEANLESTFEALKKQLAEILPQPQGITALPEYSDDEEANTESNRVFDEYRSPFDGIIGLLETEDSAPIAPQSEIFINYKRSLSPIMEESEDETCKTFVMMNETRCLDSTSSECVGTGEAIMGVTKILMASNDTLFNFEDTLGEKEDGFSPRIPSQNELRSPLKSEISTADNSLATPTESSGTEKAMQNVMSLNLEKADEMTSIGRKSPPKTISFVEESELKQDNDLCSPDQQKTFSDGTSSTTDRISSDISPTVDHDTTFTTNTIDEKTCITVLVKDDERISEISEPDWDSTTSYGECVFNSLADAPNLDFNTNNSDGDSDNDKQTIIIDNSEKLNSEDHISYSNEIEKEICRDDSGHSTQVSSTDDKSTTNNISMQEYVVNSFDVNNLNSDEKFCNSYEQECGQYEICLINDKEIYPSNQKISQTINLTKQFISKENFDNENDINFDIKKFTLIPILHQKVQINNCEIKMLNDKQNEYLNDDLTEINNHNENLNGIQSDLVAISKNEENEQHHQMDNNHHLSGEEDPWIKIDTSKECCDIKNDWDSDVDDSHSSEEFMYIRGSPSKKENVLKVIDANDCKNSNDDQISESYEDNMLILNKDNSSDTVSKPKNMKDIFEEDDNCSDFESEFIPSCWDSMAIPARSALKSPDKTSNEIKRKSKNKKRRNVAFKKQRYDSVYEYPRENVSLPPFYSESSLLSKNYGNETCFKPNYKEEFSGGFTVSSSMRPFYDCHFSNLSYTWPTDLNFSWSQSIEDMDNKKLTTYSDTIIKTDKNDLNNITKNKTMDNKRPDSGVGESAEMLSDRIPPLGELCHTKPNLHLALRQLPDTNIDIPKSSVNNYTNNNNSNSNNFKEPQLFTTESIVLPTPSCTGSMDSLSSSSDSERQSNNFLISNKSSNKHNEEEQPLNDEHHHHHHNTCYDSINTINNELSTTNIHFKVEKIRQNDSTDEDSGIESIMKVNK